MGNALFISYLHSPTSFLPFYLLGKPLEKLWEEVGRGRDKHTHTHTHKINAREK